MPLSKSTFTEYQEMTHHTYPQGTCTGITKDICHLIFMCPSYNHTQYQLTQSIGKKALSSTKLFADEKTIPHMLTYLNKIRRFKHIYRDIAPK